jgi:2-polyprenyl-3-methyl-5-hydroxy-6-metoxy-1,4-benzoquinol methylase
VGHKYDYLIDVRDDTAPARVVRMVGEGKRVLDVGAGPGSITRVLRENYGCSVTAIEQDEESIRSLTPLCERVYRLDLNESSWQQGLANEAPFDVVVVADVLEHLYDPWSALRHIRNFISPNGYIVVSLPHAGHNAILASLLEENFEYRDTGLLDRTHIRFFGIRNIQNLFEDAGFAIVEAQFVVRFPEDTELAQQWASLPAATRMALLKNKFGLVYQVIVKAVPGGAGNPTISLFDVPVPQLSGILEHPSGTTSASQKSAGKSIKLVAFFLTQFHPIPENDRWWGKGFTEWTNVTKAEPLFPGHYQPRLPTDLGFYDLRLRDVRHEQIVLAKQYGIDGFCYYYYWFSGSRLLNQPLDDMLQDSQSDMPFCLCWANENWTRRWDGADREVLIAQKHLPEDDVNFIRGLSRFFNDQRYMRLNGAPFLIVYQPQLLPEPHKTVRIWREYCEQIGIGPIHICVALTNGNDDYAQFGCDSGLQFPPHNSNCENINDQIDFYVPFHGTVVEYGAFAQSYLDRRYEHSNVFRTVCPCWDQTARVGSRAFLTLNGTPANYEYWLAESIRSTRQTFPNEERVVFINAWNEWAEGCHLEPDRRFERQFLEATLKARTGNSIKTSFKDFGLPQPVGSPTSVHARVDQLTQDLLRERERLVRLEHELSTERQRLSAAYKDSILKLKGSNRP